MVIIQYAVVHPFAGCAVFINFFVFPRTPGNWRVKPYIPVRFCIDTPPVWGLGALPFAWAGTHFLAGQWAAPFTPAAAGTVTPVYHPVTSLADRGPILINCNFIRDGFWPAPVGVKVDKRPDIPRFAKVVCGIIVIRGIKTQILDGNIRV